MKSTLFTATQIMACLMLLSPGAFAVTGNGTRVSANFTLSATYIDITCNPSMSVAGDISSGVIDFGSFTMGTVDETKSVELQLTCNTAMPGTVRVSFTTYGGMPVDGSLKNRLYPSMGSLQSNLYYDWVWGDISQTVKAGPSDSRHKGLRPGDIIDLSSQSADVYEVAPQSHNSTVLRFPMKITRGANDIAHLPAGDYTALLGVTISYE
ncbi:hypothetical protein L1O59_001690 [Salmonella enterica]|nr:hypothetical protein [Salmonella enterica]ECD6160923.1 hypothetical protein [Salmonella enterica subsp. enterica]ECU7992334.1 hypothetical protein [Salmonella enterica subsp. enterica serovar Toucra]EAW3043322.1 hypothetical protein [Salmonella enterica]EAW3060053.1 hypothetical protein [Salmonella enterica]